MTKKKEVVQLEQKGNDLDTFVKEEVINKGKSVREVINSDAEAVVSQAEEMIEKLKALEKLAIENKRPAMHFVHFYQQLGAFTSSFKRMLR